MSVEASHQKKRPLVMGDAAEGRRGAAYVFRNTDWLLTLRVNAQPSCELPQRETAITYSTFT